MVCYHLRMKYSRKIKSSEGFVGSATLSNDYAMIEKFFKKRDIRLERSADGAKAAVRLFVWNELISAKDANRFSWQRIDLKRDEASIKLHFRYNWSLQALAHFALSVFSVTFVNRFGSSEMALPMLLSMNGLFFLGSIIWAVRYAAKLSTEIAACVSEGRRI